MTEDGPSLVREVGLSPLDESDLSFVYQLAAVLQAEWPRVYGHGPLAPHTFGESLWRGVLTCFGVRDAWSTLGVTSLYDVDYRHRIGWIELVLDPAVSDQHSIRGAVAEHMSRLAFEQFGLRKLLCWHVGCQAPPLGVLGIEEARLEGSVLHEGWYWDGVITSMTAPGQTGAGAR